MHARNGVSVCVCVCVCICKCVHVCVSISVCMCELGMGVKGQRMVNVRLWDERRAIEVCQNGRKGNDEVTRLPN